MVSRSLRQQAHATLLQGEWLVSTKIRVKSLRSPTIWPPRIRGTLLLKAEPALGEMARTPRDPSGTGKGTDALAALLLFPPAPAAGTGAALGAVLLLTGLWVEYTSTAHALFELGSLTDHRRKISIHGLL